VRCEAAEREISARMDGDPDAALDRPLSEHLAGCSACVRFERAAAGIREQARLEVAPEVPNELLARIMLQAEADRPGSVRAGHRSGPRRRTAGSVAAAFAMGALAAAVAVGGLLPRGPQPALAGEVPRLIAEASAQVTEYSATLHITERNFRPETPVRRFLTSVEFDAPERFRAVTRDLTEYPSASWPENNMSVEVDGGRWRLEAPRTCPRQALPTCSGGGSEIREVTGREPFDADATLPTDIILPLNTLAGADRVRVAGTSEIADREVVTVQLAYRDAQPLFAFLHAGGSWRPFYPTDEVTLALDRETWFPVAYAVRAERSPERLQWAGSEGLNDAPGEEIFEARFEDLRFTSDTEGLRGEDPGARDAGFVDLDPATLESQAGYRPAAPAGLEGLTPYRAGVFSDPSRKGEVLTTFTRGLGWIKIRQTPNWAEPALFGNLGPLAGPVDIPGGGTGYYEPATDRLGRRLSIHGENLDVYLETNLPADQLLEVAGALPVEGTAVPPEWSVRRWPGGIVREQLTLEEALERVPYLQVPMRRPEGYEVTAVHLVQASGVEGATLFLRRPGMEADGVGIRVHQTSYQELPPPMDPDVSLVRLGDLTARYSPSRSELEWVDRGVYRSITGGGLDLGSLVSMGQSMLASKDEAEG
jgi:hypothetical protein